MTTVTTVSVERNIQISRDFLESNGFVVLRAKSYRAAQQRQRLAEAQKDWEIKERAATAEWAQRDLVPQILKLSERVTFLYGAARAAGCTHEELGGQDAPRGT